MLEFGGEDIHFAAILENNVAIEVDEGNFSGVRVSKLDKSFPYFSFLKNEDLHNLSVLTKKLIKIVMRDNIAEFVINTDEEDRPVYFRIH